MNPENTLYRQVSFEDGFDLISNGNDDKFIYLKEVPKQEQEEVWDDFRNQWINGQKQELAHSGFGYEKAEKIANEQWEELIKSYHLIKKQ